MLRTVNLLGRGLGALCGAALAVVWVFAVWIPSAGLTLPGVSSAVALLLAVIALFAVIASLHGHGRVVILMFLASFFPIGEFFLLPHDHWARWIGWADLGLLAAGVAMWATSRGGARGDVSAPTDLRGDDARD